jgi:hypothetical protein
VRILFLTTLMPGALSSGSEVASAGFVAALRDLGHQVTVIGYRRAGDSPPLHPDDVVAADRRIETRGAGPRVALWLARAIAERRPYSVAKYMSRAYTRTAARELDRDRPGLVVVDHAQMEWVVPRGGWGVPHVYLAHNVEHRLYSEAGAGDGLRARVNRREAALIRRSEERLCAGATSVWALTADDAAALADLGGDGQVAHFDVPAAGEVPPPAREPSCDVAVLGSWTWQANVAGLRWFLDEVVPLLPGGVTVEVAGSASAEAVGDAPRVRARGRVPDAMEFLQSARVVAVPSVAGSGVQVKTLDAIASGRRVVATPTAMRGIAEAPDTVEVAGEAGAFAAAVTRAVEAGAPSGSSRAAEEWTQRRKQRFRERVGAAVEAMGTAVHSPP